MAKILKGSDEAVVDKLVVIAQTYGRTKDASELSKELGLKRETVQSYANGLRSMGIDVAKMKRTGVYLRSVARLVKEAPKLCKRVKSK